MTIANQANYTTETTLRVRYQETDQMGVVYYANYLVWFEVGRSDFIRNQGYSYQLFEERGLLLPVVEVQCKYLAPARYDEEIVVLTRLAEFSGGKMVFEYRIMRAEDRKLLVTGMSKHLWVNKEMKRVNIKHLYPEVFDKLAALCPKEKDGSRCSG
ncbi:acyl-CoA thioesterase [Lihuaxuella thermophila]|uniref:Acyl-CoA thioester hydrolase n=1 Tax=Lihuaxuella thermophila TaxID=1173111 RepID=A0A1H8CRY7_9BACL|nr:acyl-CoA thioesterase [Lihuaxuella thermophila]SEM97214.1 acyl-CoA thioester hydrolase [Lihuaxuella thermophila]